MSDITEVYSSSPFDWCNSGQCGSCPGEYEQFYINTGKVKKGTSPIVKTGIVKKCPHKCHGKMDTSIPKTRKTRRKK